MTIDQIQFEVEELIHRLKQRIEKRKCTDRLDSALKYLKIAGTQIEIEALHEERNHINRELSDKKTKLGNLKEEV